MKITKKVCIYILVGFITITGTFTSFYKGAYAFEYVGGALAFEEAIKWLLASVGIISAGGMTADYWENHSQEFEDYCTQQNITDTEVANWQLKLCEGILDKGSECWQAFKDWASTLTGSSSGGSGGGDASYLASDILNAFSSSLGNPVNGISFYSSDQESMTFKFALGGQTSCYVYTDLPVSISLYDASNNTYLISFNSGNMLEFTYRTGYWSCRSTQNFSNRYISDADNLNIWTNGFDMSDLKYNNIVVGNAAVDSDFISVQQDVTDLDIISSPIPDTDAQEVAIPMPGVADSDNEASAEAYDNIVDQVNDGTLQLDDAITQVIDTLKIIVYEQETEKIFPKPDNEEDQEDLDDKINENKDNMGFTLGGLETVFPFCIPWDIYAFINLLRADSVPPKLELPFPNPLDPENPWIVEVDFSDWDDGMRIVRLAEDFLFIIGLAVLTRSLIGAGGGDG